MITLILGKKGSGKTKKLMDLCKAAVCQSPVTEELSFKLIVEHCDFEITLDGSARVSTPVSNVVSIERISLALCLRGEADSTCLMVRCAERDGSLIIDCVCSDVELADTKFNFVCHC